MKRHMITAALVSSMWLGASVMGANRVQASSPHAGHAAGQAVLVTHNIHSYRDSIGGLYIFGEVTNRGTAPAGDIGVEVDVYDNHNHRLARGATLTISSNVLHPGATGVWKVLMSDNPAHWARMHVLAVEMVGEPEALAQNYTDLSVSGVSVKMRTGGYSEVIKGTVTNTGHKPTKVAAVTAALYDQKGTLVRVYDDGILYPYSSKQIIDPGKKAPFQIDLLGYTQKPAHVVIYVRASTKGSDGFYL